VVDTPRSDSNADQPDSHLPRPDLVPQSSDSSEPKQNDVNAAQRRHYAQYIMWPFKAVWRAFTAVINWLDKNDGAVTAIATIAIAVLTAYYVHYARGQWNVMQGQLGEMIRQYPQLQKSADAATKANLAAHDALTRSNRPWLGVESVRIIAPISFMKAGSGKDITYFVNGSLEITIKNFGTSPALSVNEAIEAYDPTYFTKEKFDPTDPFAQLRKFGDSVCTLADGNEFTKKNPQMYGGSVFPTQATTYTTQGIPGFSKRNIEVGKFMQLLGCISYRDQFDEMTHHTHYCVIAPVGAIATVNNCESNTDAN
jgi:hypothetical protein